MHFGVNRVSLRQQLPGPGLHLEPVRQERVAESEVREVLGTPDILPLLKYRTAAG